MQQERETNENLKNLLGFDPESGMRMDEDRGALTEASKSLAPSPEIQTSFSLGMQDNLEKVSSFESDSMILPEQLFYAGFNDYSGGIDGRYRYHFVETPETDEDLGLSYAGFQVPGGAFSETASIEWEDEAFQNVKFIKYGERTTFGEHIEGWEKGPETVSIHSYKNSEGNNITFRIVEQDRDIRVHYLNGVFNELSYTRGNSEGSEHGFDFPMSDLKVAVGKKSSGKIKVADSYWEEQNFFRPLIGLGPISLQEVEGYEWYSELEIEIKGTNFELKCISKSGELTDTFLLPLAVNLTKVLGSLLDPRLIVDPIHAPLEADNKWLSTDFKKLIGVEWMHVVKSES